MASLSLVKKQNTIQILKEIKISGECTKPMLQNKCELTASTVHGIISQLEKDKIIRCCGISCSNGGRKASIYKINGEFKYIVSACIRTNAIKIAILNFNLKILEEVVIKNNLQEQTVQQTLQKLVTECNNLISKYDNLGKKIAGIGLTLPGPVNYQSKTVLGIPGALQWKNIEIEKHLKHLFSVNVLIEKDLNAGMLYLLYNNAQINKKSTVCLSVYDGIAAGLLIDSNVYRGIHSLAGEIGHIATPYKGKVCHCGNTDCLELYASDTGIIKLYNENEKETDKKSDIKEIIAKAESGDSLAKELFYNATKHLAQTVFNIIMMYDPHEILISCSWIYLYDAYFFELIDAKIKTSVFSGYDNVNINILNIDNFYTLGGGEMVVSHELGFTK